MRLNNTLASLLVAGSLVGCGDNSPKTPNLDNAQMPSSKPVDYLTIKGKPLSIRADFEMNGPNGFYGYLGIAIREHEGDNIPSTLTELKLGKLRINTGTPTERSIYRDNLNKIVTLVQAEIDDGDNETIEIETNSTPLDRAFAQRGHNFFRVYEIRKIKVNSIDFDLTGGIKQ
ncbi:MAG: hypothetical protein AABW73_00175 [Nanoarchaeota archaeon]